MLHSIQKILNRVFSTDGDGSLTGLLSSQQALNAVFDEERNALRVKIPDLPPAGAQIDDESTADDKVWSAEKILSELTSKADRLGPVGTPQISEGALNLDLGAHGVFDVTLTEDVTALGVANVPESGQVAAFTLVLRQDETGGRAVSWPADFIWAGGTEPELTADGGAVDAVTAFTFDSGTTWLGFLVGSDIKQPAE